MFVCDNLAFSGDGGTVVLRKKHTSRLDLSRVVPPAIDAYLEKAGLFKLDIERMKNVELTDGRAKELIFDAFARNPDPFPTALPDRLGALLRRRGATGEVPGPDALGAQQRLHGVGQDPQADPTGQRPASDRPFLRPDAVRASDAEAPTS